MMADLWAHHFFENPKEGDEFEDDSFDMDAELAAIEAEADAKRGGQIPVPDDDDPSWESM